MFVAKRTSCVYETGETEINSDRVLAGKLCQCSMIIWCVIKIALLYKNSTFLKQKKYSLYNANFVFL